MSTGECQRRAEETAARFPVGCWVYRTSKFTDATSGPWRVLAPGGALLAVHQGGQVEVHFLYSEYCRRVPDEEAILLDLAYPQE